MTTALLIISLLILGFGIFKILTSACPKGGFHTWEYLEKYGLSYQQKKCQKCGKLKIESQ